MMLSYLAGPSVVLLAHADIIGVGGSNIYFLVEMFGRVTDKGWIYTLLDREWEVGYAKGAGWDAVATR